MQNLDAISGGCLLILELVDASRRSARRADPNSMPSRATGGVQQQSGGIVSSRQLSLRIDQRCRLPCSEIDTLLLEVAGHSRQEILERWNL